MLRGIVTGRSDRVTGARGYTLIELIIALLIGTVVLSAAITFLITHIRSLEGSDIRENVSRNSRYIGALLRRDVQAAGIDIKSTTSFGTVMVYPGSPNDTLVMLHVPYVPISAPPHDVDPTANGGSDPAAGNGTCGLRCIDLLKDALATLELAPGDLARLQIDGVRRLIIIDKLTVVSSSQFAVEWTAADTLLHQPAGLVGPVQIKIASTFVQRLQPIMFYLDGENLMRAERLNADGTPKGEVVAYGVEQFEVTLVFDDGDELSEADPNDPDDSNDYDDIVAVKVTVTVKADRVDPRVNSGQLLLKTSEWQISPRNLRYEKNRV